MVWSPGPWAPAQRPTIRLFKAACLPHLPFIPALSQIPCQYHAIQHHSQRLRLHQPAFTPIHTHHRSTGGGGVQTMTMPRGGGGGATLEHICSRVQCCHLPHGMVGSSHACAKHVLYCPIIRRLSCIFAFIPAPANNIEFYTTCNDYVSINQG